MARSRFTFRTLLVTVALCAVGFLGYAWLPNTVTDQELFVLVQRGMKPDQVRQAIGEPDHITPGDEGREYWYYGPFTFICFLDGKVEYRERD